MQKKEHKLMFENPELEKQIEEDKKQEEVIQKEEEGKKKKKRKRKAKRELKIWEIVAYILFGLGAVVLVQNVCLRLLNSWHLKLE